MKNILTVSCENFEAREKLYEKSKNLTTLIHSASKQCS